MKNFIFIAAFLFSTTAFAEFCELRRHQPELKKALAEKLLPAALESLQAKGIEIRSGKVEVSDFTFLNILFFTVNFSKDTEFVSASGTRFSFDLGQAPFESFLEHSGVDREGHYIDPICTARPYRGDSNYSNLRIVNSSSGVVVATIPGKSIKLPIYKL